jgi:hypothetical protein
MPYRRDTKRRVGKEKGKDAGAKDGGGGGGGDAPALTYLPVFRVTPLIGC